MVVFNDGTLKWYSEKTHKQLYPTQLEQTQFWSQYLEIQLASKLRSPACPSRAPSFKWTERQFHQ